MKRIFNPIDFSSWSLPESEKLLKTIDLAVKKAASEAVKYAFENEEGRLSFPVIWAPNSDGRRHQAVKDPLDVYVEIPLGEFEDEGPEYIFNLREALKDDIDICAEDGSFARGLEMLRDSLRELAREIDDALPKS
ncbi:MAG: hypothetical protein C1943_00990 [Halochromatium sp.]|nr:hypothetical protein [Halochromatium sp.]